MSQSKSGLSRRRTQIRHRQKRREKRRKLAQKLDVTAAYWDGRNSAGERVTSGTYFYAMKAGNFAATRRMELIQ